ncbi:MAG: chromate transporter [Armatimonadetes bacterium]|nr:chromate transporter [Armatimonadota bacterium]
MSDLLQFCLLCARTSLLVFGGGLVMVPLLQYDVVERYQWLTQQQFLDALALGQMTPGPVLVTVTLIGYKLSGFPGAILASISMFLPTFLLTLFCSNRLQRLQGHRWVKRFLWGARPAVVGLIVAAGIMLAQQHLTAPGPIVLGILCLGALVLTEKIDTSLVVLASGLLGLALWSGQ